MRIGTSGTGATILLVEDEAPLLSAMEQVLSGLGYRIIGTRSPARALEHWRLNKAAIDLLLLDADLEASTSGIELARILLNDNATLKVIYISATPLYELGFGIDRRSCLEKPFSGATLKNTVSRVLAGI